MFDDPLHSFLPQDTHDPLRAFFDGHSGALLDAAALLGGRRGVRIARSVETALAERTPPTRRLRRDIADLLAILRLDRVHDDQFEEADLFSQIDPADPIVEKICLLTDGLAAAVAECEAQMIERGLRGHIERSAA